MSPPLTRGKSKESGTARVLGSGASGEYHGDQIALWSFTLKLLFGAGVAELLVFHPVDTIAKRLMSNKNKVSIYLQQARQHSDQSPGHNVDALANSLQGLCLSRVRAKAP
jgi:hypothetical protein